MIEGLLYNYLVASLLVGRALTAKCTDVGVGDLILVRPVNGSINGMYQGTQTDSLSEWYTNSPSHV
jgi:hypothetical protein